MLLTLGLGWTEVANALPGSAGLTAVNVREHTLRGHDGVRREVANRLIAAADDDVAAVLDEGVERAILRLADATDTMRAARARLVHGRARPTVAQGLKAARSLLELESVIRADRRSSHHADEVERDLRSVLALVKGLVAPAQWSAIVAAMAEETSMRPYLPLAGSG